QVGTFDYCVTALILGFGAFHRVLCHPTPEFFADDVFFLDSGRMLVSNGFYGINGCRETNMPPGVSALVGFFNVIMGWDHRAILRLMVIFGTFGFLASYH